MQYVYVAASLSILLLLLDLLIDEWVRDDRYLMRTIWFLLVAAIEMTKVDTVGYVTSV